MIPLGPKLDNRAQASAGVMRRVQCGEELESEAKKKTGCAALSNNIWGQALLGRRINLIPSTVLPELSFVWHSTVCALHITHCIKATCSFFMHLIGMNFRCEQTLACQRGVKLRLPGHKVQGYDTTID